MENNPDLIEELCSYILKLVGDGVPVLEACNRADAAMRQLYGGDEPYIKKTPQSQNRTSRRHHAIISEYRRGERVELLARRYGVSVGWIRKIVRQKSS